MARPTTCHRAKRHALWFMMLASLAVQPLQAQDDWPAWGRDAGNQRHSPLTQINASNISTLVPAWRYEMKEEGVPSRPSQSTPLVVDGVLYLSFPFYRVVALEPETGELLWEYTAPGDWNSPEHQLHYNGLGSMRGLAYWGGDDLTPPQIVFGTEEGELISLNAQTGIPNGRFGNDGYVDLKTPEVMRGFSNMHYGISSGVATYKHLVFTGVHNADRPCAVGSRHWPRLPSTRQRRSLAPRAARAQSTDNTRGPVGPSPYTVVTDWHEPFAAEGYAFGGNSGVFAESPDRIFVAQRGETRLPDPVPSEFSGYAGSLGINVLRETDRRLWRNCLYTLNGDGEVTDLWDQWDHLCEGSDGPGPHRIRISPYDPERRVWVVNETFHQIYVFSNDGSELLKTLGEKNVSGDDETHLGRPQDVAFLPDGRVLVADGLDNHRVIILDEDANYVSEFGGFGEGPGQFNGIHALGIGPDGLIFALDRAGGRVNVFRTTNDPAEVEFVDVWSEFTLPLDIIVNDGHVWMTDLGPLRFIKLDFEGNHLYTWKVPRDLPDGSLEIHTFTVDSNGNLYGGDNQYGRTQKFVARSDADPALIIGPPWVAR